jgi:RNA-directed DNA polymerase
MGEQQKTQSVLDGEGPGEARMSAARGAEPMAAFPEPESPSACDRLMEEVCERGNLQQALKRVKSNKGAPGVDGMTVQGITGVPA